MGVGTVNVTLPHIHTVLYTNLLPINIKGIKTVSISPTLGGSWFPQPQQPQRSQAPSPKLPASSFKRQCDYLLYTVYDVSYAAWCFGYYILHISYFVSFIASCRLPFAYCLLTMFSSCPLSIAPPPPPWHPRGGGGTEVRTNRSTRQSLNVLDKSNN